VIAIFNSLPVKEGAADRIVEMFRESRGDVQGFPGFISMEVLRAEKDDEVLVVTRWRDREAFDAWVRSDAFAKAHGRGGSEGLLRAHPRMSSYEVAVEREPENYGSAD
jgi:heme-degrading monooxygenase HmoA